MVYSRTLKTSFAKLLQHHLDLTTENLWIFFEGHYSLIGRNMSRKFQTPLISDNLHEALVKDITPNSIHAVLMLLEWNVAFSRISSTYHQEVPLKLLATTKLTNFAWIGYKNRWEFPINRKITLIWTGPIRRGQLYSHKDQNNITYQNSFPLQHLQRWLSYYLCVMANRMKWTSYLHPQ